MQIPDYRRSRFSVVEPIGLYEGQQLLGIHQAMTGAFMIKDEVSWHGILANPLADPVLLDQLLRDEILVAGSTDEAALYRCWRQEHVHKFGTMTSHTVLELACNLRCVYCIQDHEPLKMSGRMAMLVDRFWTDFIKKKKPDHVRDVYSGGEVHLNLEVLLESASRRFFFCRGNGIDYRFRIITNGTLLSPDSISLMNEIGLECVRVSMAGPARIHNRLRVFKNGGGTYEVILKNLKAISGLTRIFLETQYDAGSDDYLHVPEMLDDMPRRGIAVENVRFTPISPKRGQTEFHCGVGDPQRLLFLMNEAEKRGFSQFDALLYDGCMADYRGSITFGTDGKLKCCPATQSEEFSYGHAALGFDAVSHSMILEREFPDKCLRSCPILPICNGGCRLNSLSGGGSFKGVDCQYEALRLILGEQIRRKAKAALMAHTGNRTS